MHGSGGGGRIHAFTVFAFIHGSTGIVARTVERKPVAHDSSGWVEVRGHNMWGGHAAVVCGSAV